MFKAILQEIVDQTPGAGSVVLMGCDGIAVESVFRQGVTADKTQAITVEFSSVMKELMHTTQLLAAGNLREVTVRCDELTIVLTMLDDEYFVALLFDDDAGMGKGRYLLRRDAHKLREALE
ncbi:MAG: GTPase [Desulfuromonas sp.]|nr:MAG: GTPase [Desulfuromonas sp.]